MLVGVEHVALKPTKLNSLNQSSHQLTVMTILSAKSAKRPHLLQLQIGQEAIIRIANFTLSLSSLQNVFRWASMAWFNRTQSIVFLNLIS